MRQNSAPEARHDAASGIGGLSGGGFYPGSSMLNMLRILVIKS